MGVITVTMAVLTSLIQYLENWEIYEGVRFGFINISGLATGSFTITGLRVVAQTLPVPYTGSFNCSDTLLTRSWYTGVYCPKLNMAGGCCGSIV